MEFQLNNLTNPRLQSGRQPRPLKIVVTGPESSGKTTLAAALAERLGAAWVPEFAREFLENLGRPYVREDLRDIALGQLNFEKKHARRAKRFLICDTDLTVLHVWHRFKFGFDEPFFLKKLRRSPADLYFLTSPDFDWQPDPLRENPHDRDVLFKMYENLLLDLKTPFVVLAGPPEKRLEKALAVLSRFE